MNLRILSSQLTSSNGMVAPVKDQEGSILVVNQNTNKGNLSVFQLDRIFVSRSFRLIESFRMIPKLFNLTEKNLLY